MGSTLVNLGIKEKLPFIKDTKEVIENKIKKEINDSFFMVESLDDLLADYYSEGDNSGKSLYRKLLKNLENRGISEEAFVKELCDVIMRYENFASFATELKSKISKT